METTMTIPNNQGQEALASISREDIVRELAQLREKIQVMEWDKTRKQLNPSKAVKLNELLQRKKDLVERLDSLSK